MNDNEVNKIIAEFEYPDAKGILVDSRFVTIWRKDGTEVAFTVYTHDLNRLVRVWEKLKEKDVYLNKLGNRFYNHFCLFSEKDDSTYSPFKPFNFYESEGDTIQEAAAHATAKAILELKK